MKTRLKLKIDDIKELREKLISIYERKTHAQMAKYSVLLAKHIIEFSDFPINDMIEEGFSINEKWQRNEAKTYTVRLVGFKMHELARNSKDLKTQIVYRVIGHAVSSAHMKEHAIVASDYAIKLINLICLKDIDAVKKEREYQIYLMQGIE